MTLSDPNKIVMNVCLKLRHRHDNHDVLSDNIFFIFFQEKDIEKDDLTDLSPVNYPLLSLMSDKETTFNSVIGHVQLVCYQVGNTVFNVAAFNVWKTKGIPPTAKQP